ncbi:MAG: hypothetical protein JWN98_2461, partial [Abditibacteriota bacterium]|nr:hypothetical protein [Abditibacteriota bacterium]
MAKKTKRKSNAAGPPTSTQSTLNGRNASPRGSNSGDADGRATNSAQSTLNGQPHNGTEVADAGHEAWGERDPRYWQLALAVLVLGIGLRQILLANFPYHPDEAIHAWFATSEVFNTYRYDPIYHGPVMYHLTALVFTFFTGLFKILGLNLPGANDYTARLVPSLLGIGVLLTILYGPMRRWIGARGALWALALVAISPVIVTYSRRLLHDSLVLLLTLTAVICFQIARENRAWTKQGRQAWLGIVVALTLFVSTKANAYFIIAMLGAFWLSSFNTRWKTPAVLPSKTTARARTAVLAQEHWRGDKVLQWVPLVLFIFISIASILARRDPDVKDTHERLLSIASLLSVGVLWLWMQFGPSARAASEEDDEGDTAESSAREGNSVDASIRARRRTSAWRTGLISAWASIGIFAFFYGHGWLWWKVPVEFVKSPSAFIAQTQNSLSEIKGYATFRSKAPPPLPEQTWLDNRLVHAQDWDDVTLAIPRMLNYWGKQQREPRLPGRHDYYLVLMTLYEAPLVIAALGGIVLASRRRSAFTDLLLWWAFTSYVLYALANEKVPWLLNHIMLPFCLLGGWWLSQLRPQSTLTQRAMTWGCAAGAVFLLRGVSATNFERAVENREPMFYAQTTEDFRDALYGSLQKTANSNDPIWIHNEKQWPPAWYVRNGAPARGQSGVGFGFSPGSEAHRLIVTTETDWPIRQKDQRFAEWESANVYHYIWPRASWPALRPDRFWRWWAKRDALTKEEEKMMKEGTKTLDTLEDSILKSPGEWSHSIAVFASPR